MKINLRYLNFTRIFRILTALDLLLTDGTTFSILEEKHIGNGNSIEQM